MFTPFFFEDPKRRKKRLDQAIEHATGRGLVQDWSDDIGWSERLWIRGESWHPRLLFPTALSLPYQGASEDHGEWSYKNVVLPRGEPLKTAYGSKHGEVVFTTDVVIPQIVKGRTVWMSETPMEILTLRPGVRKATGLVVVGGLGMGWMLRKIAEKKSVKEIIVVELSKDLLDWYGSKLCAEIPKVVDVIQGNIWEVAPTLPGLADDESETRFIIDIWPGYGDASWDKNVARLRNKLGLNVWAWGESAYRGDQGW